MKDIGALTYFLGLEIKCTPQGMYVHQRNYAEDLLSMARLADGITAKTRMELNLHLKEDGNPLPDATVSSISWRSYLFNNDETRYSLCCSIRELVCEQSSQK